MCSHMTIYKADLYYLVINKIAEIHFAGAQAMDCRLFLATKNDFVILEV